VRGLPAYVADRLSAVKWRNWKAHFIWQENMYAPPQKLPLPKIINLLTDRKEERDVGAYNSWVADPVVKIVGEMEESLKKYLPIKLGTQGNRVNFNHAGMRLARFSMAQCARIIGPTTAASITSEVM
jgi:hypothetical protein